MGCSFLKTGIMSTGNGGCCRFSHVGFNGGAKHRTRENAQKPARPIFIVAASAALYHTRRRANAGNGVGGRHREMSDKIIIAEKN